MNETRKSGRQALVRRLGILAAGLAYLHCGPVTAQAPSDDGSVPCGQPYVVVRGDTLTGIAASAYGDAQYVGSLLEANTVALNNNPDSLIVGMALYIPCLDGSAAAPVPGAVTIESAVAAEGPLAPDQLDALFGPVALFPDDVLSQVLVAATLPIDVIKANRFVEASAGISDAERAKTVSGQPWDNSIKQLAAAFPDLLARMSEHIDWTEQAGEAVLAQTDDVLAAIQRLRHKAQENGYLVDNEAQNVEEVGDNIYIEPATEGVVYVPTYESEVVYTTAVTGPPAYYYGGGYYYDSGWNDALIAGGIFLGGAIILDEIFDDDWDGGWGWGGDTDIDWDGGDINIGGGDRIDIGDGDRFGNGDRPGIGDGNRPGIGDGDRPRVDHRDVPSLGNPGSIGDRPARTDPASRDAARAKIEQRQATNQGIAQLPAQRPGATQRPGVSQRPAAAQRPAATHRPAQVSRPSTARPPTARRPTSGNAFRSSGSRPHASASRGRASAGGGRGGGGGRRR